MSAYSSWGPTDDGRIKPDLVGTGDAILSSSANGDDAYSTLTGTSVSAPNVAGSLLLLQEFYARQTYGFTMRAATLKGLVLHTANEAGGTQAVHSGRINRFHATFTVKQKPHTDFPFSFLILCLRKQLPRIVFH